jgi:hypothetical protein
VSRSGWAPGPWPPAPLGPGGARGWRLAPLGPGGALTGGRRCCRTLVEMVARRCGRSGGPRASGLGAVPAAVINHDAEVLPETGHVLCLEAGVPGRRFQGPRGGLTRTAFPAGRPKAVGCPGLSARAAAPGGGRSCCRALVWGGFAPLRQGCSSRGRCRGLGPRARRLGGTSAAGVGHGPPRPVVGRRPVARLAR